MRHLKYLLSLCLVFQISKVSLSKHPQSDSKERIHDKDLSDVPHTVDGHHNPLYDQDALFGKEAEEFRNLPDSAKESRLKTLFKQMDTNHDGSISSDELRSWLKGNAMEQWSEYGLKPTDSLTWEFYVQRVSDVDGEYDDKDEESLKKHLERDKRRWNIADANQDGVLDFNEGAAFFNAETHPEMQDVVVEETIEELDRNHDGYIDQKEYIDDLWAPSGSSDEEPDWIKDERKHFDEERDKNHDGKLDKEEIKAWLFPSGDDHVESEVKHLLHTCDTNSDSMLSEDELLGCHETLIGSSLTNYGELLADHDEL